MTYHQMYRRTTLGNTLQESLDEMVHHNVIQQKIAEKVIQKFDQCISDALAKRVKNRLSLRGRLNTYRFCDNVWTLVMNNVEIKDTSTIMMVGKIKIVACEGKSAKPTANNMAANNDRSKSNNVTVDDSEAREPYVSGDEMD